MVPNKTFNNKNEQRASSEAADMMVKNWVQSTWLGVLVQVQMACVIWAYSFTSLGLFFLINKMEITESTYSQGCLRITWEVMDITARHRVGGTHSEILSIRFFCFFVFGNYCYFHKGRGCCGCYQAPYVWFLRQHWFDFKCQQPEHQGKYIAGDDFCFLTSESLWSQLK